MTDNSLYFIFIFICTFLIYHLGPSKIKWVVLLLGSILFYLLAAGKTAFLLALIPISFSYIGAILIGRTQNKKLKKTILTITVAAILLEFLLYKFSGTYMQLCRFISDTFKINISFTDNLVIPLGLAYYSMILISYVTDVYWKTTSPQKNFFKHLLFSLFFPYAAMGPMVRHNEVKDTLYSQKEIDFNAIKFGIFRILWGIAKKIIIADRIAILIQAMFNNYDSLSGYYILIASLLFGFQLYIDFASAMDISIGAAECFGIILPENFRNPLFSRNFADFWQRWHITFHFFLRDYVFFPVIRLDIVSAICGLFEKIKSKFLKNYMPIVFGYIVVWICVGIWHGMKFKYFLACGIIPFVTIIMDDVLRYFAHKSKKNTVIHKIFPAIYMPLGFVTSWFFFNCTSKLDSINKLHRLFFDFFAHSKHGVENIFDKLDIPIIIIGVVLLLLIDILKELKVDLKLFYINLPTIVRWGIITILTALIMLIGLYGPEYNANNFIYSNL